MNYNKKNPEPLGRGDKKARSCDRCEATNSSHTRRFEETTAACPSKLQRSGVRPWKLHWRLVRHQPGYTLIELLISVAIIAVLLSVSLAGVANVRVRSRDAKRIADLQTIQSALEQHAVNDPSHTYPPDESLRGNVASNVQYCTGHGTPASQAGIYNNACFAEYLAVTPTDPKGVNYTYHKPACLLPETTHGTSTMTYAATAANCSGRYAVYGLHVVLESDKSPVSRTDASPNDWLSYDLMP